ncbi:MAG TPA: hypothetical protein PLQ13_07195 [Candidatus Krumholzibacteria bacterium]|nr:hypothetical protein [Candidatus Krumholzibacteria bacterium]
MRDDDHDPDVPADDDSALEREIRRGRPFDLAEAVGRGAPLKGASPVPRTGQVLLGIRRLLESLLDDPEGSLAEALLARLADALALAPGQVDDPAAFLAAWLDGVLGSDARLDDLVREADVHWGRTYGERPRFEGDGPPAPDDPYTRAGVRAALTRLRQGL